MPQTNCLSSPRRQGSSCYPSLRSSELVSRLRGNDGFSRTETSIQSGISTYRLGNLARLERCQLVGRVLASDAAYRAAGIPPSHRLPPPADWTRRTGHCQTQKLANGACSATNLIAAYARFLRARSFFLLKIRALRRLRTNRACKRQRTSYAPTGGDAQA